MFPSLRKTLRPSAKAIIPGEVKSAGRPYFDDLQRQLSAATGREWSVDRAVKEGYERIVWVFRPVGVIAENQAARKYVLKQGAATVDDHPIVRLLNKKANPMETGRVFRKRLSSQILLSKPGAFVEVSKTRGGEPFRLDLLPPGRVTIVPGDENADPRDLTSLIDHYELRSRDGTRVRAIEPENVRWFRDPHPTDPYSGMTPLEAAGMSVELDHFARLYNVMWLRNDGRPGGIVAVHGELDDSEMTVIERKFDKGPMAAGKLTVLSADGLSFIDPGSKPRDMSYAQLAKNAKMELLGSFGVPETMMGYAGDKTFANASQERLVFWQDTMPPHLAILTDGFDEDSDDELEGEFDTSDVEVLAQIKDAALTRAQAEVAAGLRSPYSYAQLAGIDEIEDTIHTRSLYIAAGKSPLPINEADAEAMGLGEQDPAAAGPDAAGGASPDGAAAPGADPTAAGADPTAAGGSPEGATPAGPGAAAAALGAAQAAAGPIQPPSGGGAAAAALAGAAAPATKSLAPGSVRLHVVGKDNPVAWATDDADDETRDQLEAAIESALGELADGWVERTAARMASVKSRKGTRHWNPQGDRPVDTRVDTKALDPSYAVDDQAWADEAEQHVSPLLIAAALIAAQRTWSNLSGAGATPATLTRRATDLAAEVAAFVGAAAARMAVRLAAAINEADQAGLAMPAMTEAVMGFRGRLGGWARAVAVQAATATTESARSIAAKAVADPADPLGAPDERTTLTRLVGITPDSTDPANDPDPNAALHDVVQAWRTRGDERVRPSHRQAAIDNRKVPIGGLFDVGGFLLRFPGDPLAPPSETRECRCRIQYRARRTGKYVPVPNPIRLEAAQ
jgi:HK97 family phage portal protein